jgi:phospholipase C
MKARCPHVNKELDNLEHIVVLMMENRSVDHMLRGLSKKFPKINGLTGNEANPDSAGNMVQVSPTADYRGQLSHGPDHHFPGVDVQIYGDAPFSPRRAATMQGFVQSYGTQGSNVQDSHAIHEIFLAGKNSGAYQVSDRVCSLQRLVLVYSGSDDLQPGVCSLSGRVRVFSRLMKPSSFVKMGVSGSIPSADRPK